MEPKEQVEALEAKAMEDLNAVNDTDALTTFRNTYLAKKSELSALMGKMKDIPADLRGAFGKIVNDTRARIEAAFNERKEAIEKKAMELKLKAEEIDLTLPGRTHQAGAVNPCWIIVDEMMDVFSGMGFDIVEGRDVETDHFNFELLNVPKDHPARDMQDTFYIDESLLLRTQTSAAQAHYMLSKGGKEPIKMICPGKCFRRDDDDATHSHQFGQIEGLVVDKNISLADLKGTLELFVKKMFGEKREIRLRSSFFPFTEPSVEVDVSCAKCGGKGCNICKGTGWIEILGAGEVHPNVLRMCGYDPEVYSGFAFGVGIERLAMLRFGIDDIRRIYANDVRFLKDFTEK